MTRKAAFIRKIVYISIIAVLLIPLSYLSQPSGYNVREYPGGMLDRMRRDNNLSQSSLGEVDPTSETMKLATLGMRGVATTILWQQANEHKKKENWDQFAAVLRQISKLQPHFIQVWIFQAWNQSYNVSVEFDDYEYRYHWVKKGIDYLIEGTRFNQNDVRLQWQLGWVFGHKIGRSDERQQFRRLFKKDDMFHEQLPFEDMRPVQDFQGDIDNWLVGREFFLRAIALAESPKGSKRWGQSPVLFFSEPTMQSINYSETIVEEGEFSNYATDSWKEAGREWTEDYGRRQIETSVDGLYIQLAAMDEREKERDDLIEQIEAMFPDFEALREELRQEKYDALTDKEREAYDLPADERNDEQVGIAYSVEKRLEVKHEEVIERAPQEIKDKGLRLGVQLSALNRRIGFIDSYRSIVNYQYWATRCDAEQTEEMINARRDVHEAAKLYEQAVLTEYTDPITDEKKPGAKQLYESAFKNFASVFERYPVMLDNPETEDLLVHIDDYRTVLGQLEEDLPEDFDLRIILEIFDALGQRRGDAAELAKRWAVRREALRRIKLEEERAANDPTNPRNAEVSPPTVPGDDEAPSDSTSSDPRNTDPSPPTVSDVDQPEPESDPRTTPPSPPEVE